MIEVGDFFSLPPSVDIFKLFVKSLPKLNCFYLLASAKPVVFAVVFITN